MSDFKDLTNEMKKTNQKVDNLSKTVADSTKSAKNDTTKLTQGVGEVIRQDVGEGVKDLAKTITGPISSFANAIPGLSTLGKVAKTIGGNALASSKQREKDDEKTARENKSNTLLEAIGNNILDLKDSMLKGLAKTTGFGLGAIAGLIAAPVIALVSFFKTLAVEFKFLTTLTKKLVGGKFFAPLRFAFDFISKGFRQLFNLARFGLKVALAPARIFFDYFPSIGKAFTSLTKFVTSVVKGAKFGEFFAFIGKTLMRAVNFVKGLFVPVIRWFKTLTTVSGAATGAFSGIAKFAAGFGAVLGKIFLPITILMSAFDFITGFMDGYEEGGILGGLEGGLTKLFGNLIGMPLDLLKNAIGWIAGVFGFDGVEKALASFSFKDLIGDMIGGIFDGVDGIFAFLGDLFDFSDLSMFGIFKKLVDIVFLPLNLAINFVKGIFGFGDPDEPFSLGAFIGEMVTSVINWFKTLFTDPVAALGQLWKTLLGGYDSLFSLMSWPIDAAINWIMGIFGWSDPEGEPFSLWGTIKSALMSVWEWLAGLFTFDLGGAIEGLLPSWTPGWVRKSLGLSGGDELDESTENPQQNALNAFQNAKDSGFYNKNILGNSEINREQIGGASDLQLQTVLADQDISDEDKQFLQDELARRRMFAERQAQLDRVAEADRAKQMEEAQAQLEDTRASAQSAGTIVIRQGDTTTIGGSGGGTSYIPVTTTDRDSAAWNGTSG
jgi:hypothetical protein